MEIFLIKALQFLLAISLLVLLHEGGHFFFAKLFGVRVEKFYLFFDPSIWKWNGSIFKWKPKKSDTTYGVGWLPLGGYCKIAGMIDESMDTEQMKQPEQPWSFVRNLLGSACSSWLAVCLSTSCWHCSSIRWCCLHGVTVISR